MSNYPHLKAVIYIFSTVLISGFFFFSCSSPKSEDYTLYVGTYTGEGSEGIYVLKFNTDDGTLVPVDTVSGVENPSYLALSPDSRFLYAVNENADSLDASLSAFAVDTESGSLSFLNSRNSRGGAPCYIDIDAEGQSVFAGNYLGGSLAMFSIDNNGSLLEAESVIRHEGSSVNANRQQSPHVHCTLVTPDNRMLLAADLGTDKVVGYAYDAADNSLEADPVTVFQAEPGAGPRHLTFHPNGNYAYLINELNGTIDAFSYSNRALEHIQTVSTLPEKYNGAVSGADIHLSPDGSYLYASNREDLNNIVSYAIDPETGKLSYLEAVGSGGIHPRNFVIDPSGRFLLVANRHSNNIVVFKRDPATGMLETTGIELALSQPVCLKFLAPS